MEMLFLWFGAFLFTLIRTKEMCKLFFCRRRSYQFAQSSTKEFFQHIYPAFTIFSSLDVLTLMSPVSTFRVR